MDSWATERYAALIGAATDLRYAARQLEKAAEYTRGGNLGAAQDALNRACEGTDRVCDVLGLDNAVSVCGECGNAVTATGTCDQCQAAVA